MDKGYTHVYTGGGKGKTTAMLGLALRAFGTGLRVYIGQFIKNGEFSEIKAIKKYLPGMKLEQYGIGFVLAGNVKSADTKTNENGLKKAAEAMFSGNYDIIMLDEINTAVHCGLIGINDVINFISKKPQNVELVLTGNAHKQN